MLAPQNDFGYSSHNFDQHQSGERPKLYGMDHHHGMQGLAHHGGMNEFQQMVNGTPHGSMAPHEHSPTGFDHEPLMLNMHNGNHPFYPQMGQGMLHVSADYGSGGSVGGATPSSTNGSKRSREDLNMKEKKRMFKLNERINQLKEMLDDAGVQSKKNKQSILDNTTHYIGMLRSNLLIAKQKAERAEKQAEQYRLQAQKGGNVGFAGANPADLVFKRCFDQSSTPRLIVNTDMEVVSVNSAFITHAGQSEINLKNNKDILRNCLCVDGKKLNEIVKNVTTSSRPVSVLVQAKTASGMTSLMLLMSSIADETGKAAHLDISLVPFEIASELPQATFNDILVKSQTGQESSPSGVAELTL